MVLTVLFEEQCYVNSEETVHDKSIECPLQKLYPLEITREDTESAPSTDQHDTDASSNNDTEDVSEIRDTTSETDDASNRLLDNGDDDRQDTSIHRRLPKRAAAVIGDERRRQQQMLEDYDSFDEFEGVN